MNPYGVTCDDCGTVATGLGLEAAFGIALEHTVDGGHKCQIATTDEIVTECDLAGMGR